MTNFCYRRYILLEEALISLYRKTHQPTRQYAIEENAPSRFPGGSLHSFLVRKRRFVKRYFDPWKLL